MPPQCVAARNPSAGDGSRRQLAALTIVVACWPAVANGQGPTGAQSETVTLARLYVEPFAERLRLAAENDFRRRMADGFQVAAGDQAPLVLATTDAEGRRALAAV